MGETSAIAGMGVLLGLTLGALLAGGLVWWRLQRRLREAATRVEHLEHTRHQAVQHTTQARRQIEQLQKENGELRHLLARSGQPAPPRAAAADPEPADTGESATAPAAADTAGFAPTQLISR